METPVFREILPRLSPFLTTYETLCVIVGALLLPAADLETEPFGTRILSF